MSISTSCVVFPNVTCAVSPAVKVRLSLLQRRDLTVFLWGGGHVVALGTISVVLVLVFTHRRCAQLVYVLIGKGRLKVFYIKSGNLSLCDPCI